MPEKPPVIVSACLAGLAARYDGTSMPHPEVLELLRRGRALPVCPEQLGGLPTPRPPHEIAEGRVLDITGADRSEQFRSGAEQALQLALRAGCKRAVLKSRSPSCGSGMVYDGSFSGGLVPGDGLFAKMLKEAGIEVLTEEEV
jgi:uncharacterized protein YbbK (DUF523 family)